jgi:hypothetical protein
VGRLSEKVRVFQVEVFAALREVRAKVEAKANSQELERQTAAVEERLRQLYEHVCSKSDKLEVKKALLFLEAKLKEVVLVLSEEEAHEKDALLTKKQLKCASCDKDVDRAAAFANPRGNWDALPPKHLSPEALGKCGLAGFGALSKKLRKLDEKELSLPLLKSKKNNPALQEQPPTNANLNC